METFIGDKNRFEQRVKKRKVFIFGKEGVTFGAKNGENKLIETIMERDLFGGILFLALQRKVDMGEVLAHPKLTPIPLALCHVDGKIHKTQKVALMYDLEK